jgi:hypothetical protein
MILTTWEDDIGKTACGSRPTRAERVELELWGEFVRPPSQWEKATCGGVHLSSQLSAMVGSMK